MNTATATLSLTLGTIAGLMGIEHGIGEVLAGNRPTQGIFILSWPDSKFFEIMSGEPAMTLIPNYLMTGVLAILLSLLFLIALFRPGSGAITIAIRFGLLILMLLAGAGFGPPVVGFIAVLIGLKSDSALKTWRRLPARLNRFLGRLWPWSFLICLGGWLMLFPGAVLIAHFTGLEDALIMFIPMMIAFAFIPITLLLGFSRDLSGPSTISPAAS